MLNNLPLSFADFRRIRERKLLYVDKTEYIFKLVSEPKMYFLSRPRRFGKSMTVSTLHELYKGSKELFEGLWIEKHWDWSRRNPVIRLSFKDLDIENYDLNTVLSERLVEIGAANGLVLKNESPPKIFRNLLEALSKIEKVVVLIDEYDDPMLHYLSVNTPLALENREKLKAFYTVLKENSGLVEMVFITGVSKFAKVGIFSGLNNFCDISQHRDYAMMLGYSQEELETNFEDYLARIGAEMQITRAELLDKMRFWYNGYRFEENAATVYNPVSCNSFFDERKFKNFWFETATPRFLINHLRENLIYRFSTEAIAEAAFNTFQIEDLNTYGLLYQTGYLTIKGLDELGFYYLDYPNYEVEKSMVGYLLDAFSGLKHGEGIGYAGNIERALAANDIPKVVDVLKTIFKTLPYELHIKRQNEAFYHAIIHLFFTYIGIIIQSEVSISDGRCDAIVTTKTHIYILEFKLDLSPEAAFAQIIDKNYAQAQFHKGKPVIGVGINFSSETKNVTGYFMREIIN